jgi:outer membrane immunogenic protein
MKKLALSVAALALTAGSALAADLPSRKAAPILPPPPPPPPMWTGFYVGLNAGGTWAASSNVNIVSGGLYNDPANAYLSGDVFAASANGSLSRGNGGGFIGGGQIGYNWQAYNSFVVGVEADIQGIAGSGGSARFVGAATASDRLSTVAPLTVVDARGSLDFLGTVRGRLGYLVTPTLLVYGTGGLAYGGMTLNAGMMSVDTAANPYGAGFGAVNFSNTQVGWTAGGGLEWMFMPNWSAKVEYLYYDLGSVRQNTVVTGTDVTGVGTGWAYASSVSARLNGNLVRAGLNYHFNWGAPAPVVAKY